MRLLNRLFGGGAPAPASALYAAVVARGRAPHWYVEGAVPDSIDGRFDMIAAVLAMLLLRLEGDPEGKYLSTALAERFVDDMDGQMRESGFGDVVVGKQVGRMMGMLGGRLGAYREALAAGDLAPALRRNLYRGCDPADAAVAHVAAALSELRESLDGVSVDTLAQGGLPE